LYIKTIVDKYLVKCIGAFVALMSIVGMLIISNDIQLTSFSHMFLVYVQYCAWILMACGVGLIWYKSEVGIGFVGLAIFADGDVHNYIMSPLIVLLMLLYYIRTKHYYWLLPQIVLALIQGLIYVWFHNPPNQYFYLTEGFGFLIGGLFFALYGTNHNTKPNQLSTQTNT
jgi:hypothetical protein